MLLRSLLGFLAVSTLTAFVGAAASTPDLTLPHLFSVELQVTADANAIVYPFGGGQRLNIGFVDGSMATQANGTVATVISGLGGEQGVIRNDGVLLLDVRIVLQVDQSFDPDRKFVFFGARGKAVFGTDGSAEGLAYVELETDSPPFAYLNGYFLIGKVSRVGVTLHVDVYGANPSTI